jgi:lysophospholipase L1-like esterase
MLALAAALALHACVPVALADETATAPAIEWHDPAGDPFAVDGFAWFGRDRVYRRLPVAPAHPVRPEVDQLANNTAGGRIRFRTNSRRVWVQARLSGPAWGMYHMPSTGQSGFDLYYGTPDSMRFSKVSRTETGKSDVLAELLDAPAAETRDILIELPLYNGVRTLRIGVDPGSEVLAPSPLRHPRPVVIYGTSITQGGVASRPGMAWTNILSRRLGVPVVNLGFSGNGRGEPELARLMAEIEDPALIVLDYEPNADTGVLEATLEPFIRILRARHARTPILVVSRTPYALDLKESWRLTQRIERRDFQRALVSRLRAEGDSGIHFHDGSTLFGNESADECTVDGVHPNDLGFWRIAEHLRPVVQDLLAARARRPGP